MSLPFPLAPPAPTLKAYVPAGIVTDFINTNAPAPPPPPCPELPPPPPPTISMSHGVFAENVTLYVTEVSVNAI